MGFKERTEIILGTKALDILEQSSVAVYGLGGVGAAAAIDLVRCGVGKLYILDFDTLSESNLNRHILGFIPEIGKNKSDLLKEAACKINPDIQIITINSFIHGDSAEEVIVDADFYIDAIDSLNPKVNLIYTLINLNKKFISSMGTAGRIDPSKLKIADIWKTNNCSLAAFVRKRLRKRKISAKFPVVFSDELPIDPVENEEHNSTEKGRARKTQGSTPFVPQTAGHFLASYAVKAILNSDKTGK